VLAADDGIDAVRAGGARLHQIERVDQRGDVRQGELVAQDGREHRAAFAAVGDEHARPLRILGGCGARRLTAEDQLEHPLEHLARRKGLR